MLDSGTVRANRGVRDCSQVNFSQPFPFATLPLIAAALGAIVGLYFSFHGFSLLQQRHFDHARSLLQKTPHPATVATPAPVASREREPHPEVIQLSPAAQTQIDSASMTQQGKIAAALLRAGIPNPVMTPANRVPAGVADLPSNEPKTTDSEVDAARVLQKGAGAPEISLPSLNSVSPRPSASWKATAMIWGGPALTLACIYVLAAHLGWL